MLILDSLAALDAALAAPGLLVLFVSQPDCAICTALLPKVVDVVGRTPRASLAYLNAADVPDVASRLSVLSAPVVLGFAEGREVLREGRFLRLEAFESALLRLAGLLGEDGPRV